MQSARLQVCVAQSHQSCLKSVPACEGDWKGTSRQISLCALERRHSAREALWEHSGVRSQQVRVKP